MSARRLLPALGVLLIAAVTAISTAVPAYALPGFSTGPVDVVGAGTSPAAVQSVTVGRNDGYDRVVFTLDRPVSDYHVHYTDQITADASGAPVEVAGSAFLAISMFPVAADPAQPTLTPDFPTLQGVVGAGFFEAVASYGLGLRNDEGFRVFTLTGPDRLVVDVAHPAGQPAATSAPQPTTTGAFQMPGGSVDAGAGGAAPAGFAALPLATALAGLLTLLLGVLAARRMAATRRTSGPQAAARRH